MRRTSTSAASAATSVGADRPDHKTATPLLSRDADADADDSDDASASAAAAAAAAGPVSVDPNWKRLSAGLDALEENKALLDTLFASLREQPHSARLQRSLNQLRISSTSQCSDLHLRFLRLKPSQLERYRPLALRFQELTAAINELVLRCAALAKSTAPAPLLDPDSPKRARKAREKASADAKSSAVTDAGGGNAAAASPTIGVAGAAAATAKPKGGAGPSPNASPNASPALKPNPVRALPPPHFALSGGAGENNPIAAAAAASPYAVQQSLLATGAPGPTGDADADAAEDEQHRQVMAQLTAVPWSADEQARDEMERARAHNADVAQVGAMVAQVREMFGDLQQIVAKQQVDVDAVQQHVADAKQHAENGLEQIAKASRYKSFGMALGGGLVGMLLGGPLGFVAGTKTGLGFGLAAGALLGGGAGRLVGASLRTDAAAADAHLAEQRNAKARADAAAAAASADAKAVPLSSLGASRSSGGGGSGSGDGYEVVPSALHASAVRVLRTAALGESFAHVSSGSGEPLHIQSVQSLALSTPSLAASSSSRDSGNSSGNSSGSVASLAKR